MEELDDNFINNKDLEKGMFILLREHPCIITYIAHSKMGKHGLAKMLITGIDIFTSIKYEDIYLQRDITQLLKTSTTSYLVTNLDNNVLHALDEKYNQEIQIDLASENLQKEVMGHLINMNACVVTILSYKNLHKIIEICK